MRIVVFGPPGSGKGSLAMLLAKDLNIPHISSGDIFREEIAQQTKLGDKVKEHVECGQLVPDSTTITRVFARLALYDCKNGYILDGYPRTRGQAERCSRDKGIGIDTVVQIVCTEDTVIGRLCGRYTCKTDGTIHNKRWDDITKCKVCGGELFQRVDDTQETVLKRLEYYNEESNPILDYMGKMEGCTIYKIDSDITESGEMVYAKFKEKYKDELFS